MKKIRAILTLTLAALTALPFLTGCGKQEQHQKIENIYRHLLDEGGEKTWLWLDTLPAIKEAYLGYVTPEDQSARALDSIARSEVLTMFGPAVDSVWPSLGELENQLGAILAKSEELSLKFPHRSYASAIWGRTRSMLLTDSALIVAMNLYLGEDHPAYEGWPDYLKKFSNPKLLPYDLVEAITTSAYPFDSTTPDSPEAIEYMLYYGAITYVKMLTVPDADEALAMAWTEDELEWAKLTEKKVWAKMVSDDMLYTKDAAVARELIARAPCSALFRPETPDRLGIFIGYQIVKSYVGSHKDIAPSFLLSKEFYGSRSTLVDAGYQP